MIKSRLGSFQADFILNGSRIRRQFKTASDAEQFEKESLARAVLAPTTLAAFVNPTKCGAIPTSLRELFDKVQELHWSLKKSPETSESNANMIIEILGDLPLSLMNDMTLDKLVSENLKLGRSAATINRKLSCLQKALNFAAERGWITGKLPTFRRLPEPKGRMKFFTSAEEKAILDGFQFLGDPDMRDLVIVLFDTGMRLGEALRLTCADLDLHQRLIRIWVNKADHPRSVPMTGRVYDVLVNRYKVGLPLFAITENQVEHRWSRMRTTIGTQADPDFIIHTIRHTCASRLINAGEDLLTVKEWLGHKSIQTTIRYAHLAPAKLKAAANRLESFSSNGCSLPSVTKSQSVTGSSTLIQ